MSRVCCSLALTHTHNHLQGAVCAKNKTNPPHTPPPWHAGQQQAAASLGCVGRVVRPLSGRLPPAAAAAAPEAVYRRFLPLPSSRTACRASEGARELGARPGSGVRASDGPPVRCLDAAAAGGIKAALPKGEERRPVPPPQSSGGGSGRTPPPPPPPPDLLPPPPPKPAPIRLPACLCCSAALGKERNGPVCLRCRSEEPPPPQQQHPFPHPPPGAEPS